jgi:nucleoside phosphorylase
MTVLIVAPTEREARSIRRARSCGAGAAARDGLARLLDAERPSAVLIAGWCGGLDPSLAPGDLILSRSVVAPGNPELLPRPLVLDAARRELRRRRLRFVSSRLLTVERPVARRSAKVDLWNEFGAAGVDMETYYLAAELEARRIPWLAVRVVLDPAGWDLPDSLASWTAEGDERAAIRRAVLRPWEWLGYARLALALPNAERSLRRAAAFASSALATAPVEELPVVIGDG